MRPWALLVLLPLVACTERERDNTPRPRVPSCALPVCPATCACDQTFACEEGCACDPECGQCRDEGATCAAAVDAGSADRPDGQVAPDAPEAQDAGDAQVQDTGVAADGGACAFPTSQGLSQPCCLSHGIDACGAGLFCAAFDGRTQPTCYADRSRLDLESCGADRHCASGQCDFGSGLCRSQPNAPCTTVTGCVDSGGTRYGCHPGTLRCTALGGEAGDFCLAGPDCRSGACATNVCVGAIGDACTMDSECGTRLCFARVCSCSPAEPQGCAAGENCLPGAFDEITCQPEGATPIGGVCNAITDCRRPGLCIDGGEGPRCHEACRPSASQCPAGQGCAPISLGGGPIDLGVCL